MVVRRVIEPRSSFPVATPSFWAWAFNLSLGARSSFKSWLLDLASSGKHLSSRSQIIVSAETLVQSVCHFPERYQRPSLLVTRGLLRATLLGIVVLESERVPIPFSGHSRSILHGIYFRMTTVLDGSDATSSIVCGFFSRWTFFWCRWDTSRGHSHRYATPASVSWLGWQQGKTLTSSRGFSSKVSRQMGHFPVSGTLGVKMGVPFLPTRRSGCTFVKAF